MGQAQQKAARHLDGLPDAAGQVVERRIVADQIQQRGEQCGVQIRLEQAFELLVDALGNGALAEAVAAGNKKGGHQRFPVDEGEKRRQGQAVAEVHRVKLGGMGQHDGDHAAAFHHVEHPDGVDGAGLGSLHGKRSFLAPFGAEKAAAQMKCTKFKR